MKNIYVGNLSPSTTGETLKAAFAPFGAVAAVNIITGRGFGFVEMTNDAEGMSAISALNGKTLDGSALTVNEARPKKSKAQSHSRH
jgi:RNA recognition motif-containing protein